MRRVHVIASAIATMRYSFFGVRPVGAGPEGCCVARGAATLGASPCGVVVMGSSTSRFTQKSVGARG